METAILLSLSTVLHVGIAAVSVWPTTRHIYVPRFLACLLLISVYLKVDVITGKEK